jgi:hypothetical protein
MGDPAHSLARRLLPVLLIVAFSLGGSAAARQSDRPPAKGRIALAEARPFLTSLRPELIPRALSGRGRRDLEVAWPQWVAQHDAAIRARVTRGDEDSIVNLLFFGTSFTSRPRPTETELGQLVTTPTTALAALRPRVDDFVKGVAAPGGNERLQFARQVVMRDGIDPATPAGREMARQYFERRMFEVGREAATHAPLAGGSTIYADRGLSSDTSVAIDYGIDHTIEALAAAGIFRTRPVRRVAIVGPGLDFSDKYQGYDFYPQQTIQPFAVVDSLLRHRLATAANLRLTALDLSARVVQHVESARRRARAGRSYGLVLPRNDERHWTPGFVAYWQRLGDRIGARAAAPAVPPNAGRVQVRSVAVRPAFVLAMDARDLNIVLERLEPRTPAEQFDLIIATNILLYYDVFEQSLAAVNIATMLRPGGVFLTNNPPAQVPGNPLRSIGYTDTVYTTADGHDDTGDRIVWYQR